MSILPTSGTHPAEVALVKFHTLFHPKLGITVDAVTMTENA